MSGLPGTPSVGDGLPTAVQSESKPHDAELAQSGGAGSAVNLPEEPAAPNGVTVVNTQEVLTKQTKHAPATGTKSEFRLLLEAGHANVHGWWGKNGRLNYARKCITDIPKGFLQGVFSGLSISLMSLHATAVNKGRFSNTNSEPHYLGCYEKALQGVTRFALLRALGTSHTVTHAQAVDEPSKSPPQPVDLTKAFANTVKESGNVTYTPSKVVSFGIGAVVGAAVPSLFALIGFGIADWAQTRKPEQAGSVSSAFAADRLTTGASDPMFRKDSDA